MTAVRCSECRKVLDADDDKIAVLCQECKSLRITEDDIFQR